MERFILLSFAVYIVYTGSVLGEQCGDKTCKYGEVCESGDDGGTCYNSSLRIDCSDGITYCYKPRLCCGVGTCCPANSECCGLNTCCPHGAVCCSPNYCCEHGASCCGFQQCCPAGATCQDGECRANHGDGKFHWWYVFFFVGPLLAIVFVILRRRRLAAQRRGAVLSVQSVPIETAQYPRPENYGYDQNNQNQYDERPHQMPPYAQSPPAYSDVVN